MKPLNSLYLIAGICLTFISTSLLASNTAPSKASKHGSSSPTDSSHSSSKPSSKNGTKSVKHGKAHWAYTGSEGPSHWGRLSEEYSTCSAGKNQSPINIDHSMPDTLFKLNFHYQSVPMSIHNNGHTIQINYNTVDNSNENKVSIGGKSYLMASAIKHNSTLSISGEVYKLLQIHFHSPSEHNVDNESSPLEAHFVHINAQNQLAVVGVLFEYGKENHFLSKLWNQMPTSAGPVTTYNNVTLNANNLLPRSKAYYHYRGSLTTPPCSEGVRWFVMRRYIEVSKNQIQKFNSIVGNNNRPIQHRNNRFLLRN